jgi:hypothetical protein
MAFTGVTMLLDWGSGGLTLPRAVLWILLGLLLFAVFALPRVTVSEGWLAVRGLTRTRRVRVDALTEVRRHGDIAACLVLRDAYGHRLELDPRVLDANPMLWHQLDAGARRSGENGTLRHGTGELRRPGDRIDGSGALAVLRGSGMDWRTRPLSRPTGVRLVRTLPGAV